MTLSQQGSARAPQKRDLEEKPWRYVVGLPWKSRLKSALKPPIYRWEGGEEAASKPKGLAEIGGGGVLLQSY